MDLESAQAMAARPLPLGEEVLGEEDDGANGHQHHRQSGAEGDQEQKAQPHASERDRAQQQDERGFARDQAAACAQRDESGPGEFLRHVRVRM